MHNMSGVPTRIQTIDRPDQVWPNPRFHRLVHICVVLDPSACPDDVERKDSYVDRDVCARNVEDTFLEPSESVEKRSAFHFGKVAHRLPNMFYLCTSRSIFDTRVDGTVGRQHTDDRDKYVSREHLKITRIDNENECIHFKVLSQNGIAMCGMSKQWIYFEKEDIFQAFRGDVVSLHVVRRSARPCRVDSLVSENMHDASCFRVVTEDDLIAELEEQLF